MIIKIVIFALMVGGYIYGNTCIEPLLKNSVYINQMSSTDISFIIMQYYPFMKGLYIVISGMLFGLIIKDLVKEYKNNKENENE